jgi:threonine dehydrogenase-like Zn-dependent dehydrogenase
MRALTYHGAKDVRVENVPDPVIRQPDDIILRVTATAICGSDLHLYRGRIPGLDDGDILGHEFMGLVEEAGPEVTAVKRGDRVVIPFVIACGQCFFCAQEQYACCETTNDVPGATMLGRKHITPPAALFGYTKLYGGIDGGQSDFVRVPKANVGPMKVPGSLSDERVLFLSDILPTGYQAAMNARITQGSSVAILGAGPVGLMAAACARLLGAETIYMVDRVDYRLQFAAQTYGVIPLNFEKEEDFPATILQETRNRGVDASIDAIGFEAKGSAVDTALAAIKAEGSSGQALRWAIAITRRGGVISIPGVYAGFVHAFMIGDAFDKGIAFAMGQTHVQKYMPRLLQYVEDGELQPDIIISHRLKLADAARGYEMFEEKQDECRKVVLTP